MPWLVTDGRANYDAKAFRHGVAQWPHPNTERINPFYRLGVGEGLPFPRASRYLFLIQPYYPGDETFFSCYIDLVATAENTFTGDSGVDPDGRKISLNMFEVWDPLNPTDPANSWHMEITYERAGFTPFTWVWRWDVNFLGFDLAPMAFSLGGPFTFPWDVQSDWTSGPVNDWSASPTKNHLWWATQSECGDPGVIQPDEPFALFNGIDSYIHWTPNIGPLASSFLISGEVYLRSAVRAWVLTHSTSTTTIFGFQAGLCHWRSNNGLITPALPLDEWFEFEFEREWLFPTGNRYRLRINGVERANFNGPNYSLSFDESGVRHGVSPTQWSNFDLRNLVILTGSPASPIVELDAPLFFDACDSGPNAIKGETFNMDLPSCP